MTAPAALTGPGDLTAVTVTSSAVLRGPKPANTTDGDLLIGVVYYRNTGGLPGTVPPGWARVPVAHTATGTLAVYWRRITQAATEPDYYTWRSVNGASRGGLVIFRVTGASTTPIDATGATATGSSSAIAAPAVNVAGPEALLIGCYATAVASTTVPALTPPPGMTTVADVPVATATASSDLLVTAQPVTGPASTGARTATISPAATAAGGFLFAVAAPGGGQPTPPAVVGRLAGGVTHTTATLTAVTQFTGSARFAYSPDAGMPAPAYTAAVLPDRDGIVSATLTGLAPDTVYHWAVELDGALTPQRGRLRTNPTPGAAVSFSFAAGSCADTNSDATTFDDIAARTSPTGQPARFFAHLGDMHYQNIGVNDPAWALGCWLTVLRSPRQQALYASMPLAYTWSDHDWGGSNSDRTNPAGPASQAVYRRLFPSHPLPADGAGIYQTWVVGRVRFILTDGRSYADPIAQADDTNKTKLGSAQKAWLKQQLAAPEPVKVWFHEDAWSGASTFTGDDTWTAYNTERQELAAFIQTNGAQMLYVHGDYHCLGADDGSHSPGLVPVVSVSPLDQTPFAGNGRWSGGFHPDPATGSTYYHQYGWFDVIDQGGPQIVIRFTGISDGTPALRQVFSFGAARHIGWGPAF